MKSSTKNARSARDVSYYRHRYQNRFFAKLVAWIEEEAKRQKISKKDLAERMGKDPGQLSRLLGQPSNLTLDTISDLLLAFDAEAEPPEIVLFKDRRAPNYVHPLISRALNLEAPQPVFSTSYATTGDTKFTLANDPSPSVFTRATTN